MTWTSVALSISGDACGPGRERSFRDLFLRQPAISSLTYLDATGTACVHAYSKEVDKIDSLDLRCRRLRR